MVPAECSADRAQRRRSDSRAPRGMKRSGGRQRMERRLAARDDVSLAAFICPSGARRPFAELPAPGFCGAPAFFRSRSVRRATRRRAASRIASLRHWLCFGARRPPLPIHAKCSPRGARFGRSPEGEHFTHLKAKLSLASDVRGCGRCRGSARRRGHRRPRAQRSARGGA